MIIISFRAGEDPLMRDGDGSVVAYRNVFVAIYPTGHCRIRAFPFRGEKI